MPSTVSEVFGGPGLSPAGVVRWGEPIPETKPGVYAVALTEDTDSAAGAVGDCPLDPAAVKHLLSVRPELRLDGKRPTAAELTDRLAELWLGDETVVYIGLAGTSVQSRVSAYYRTPLGARSPHAGGWPLKTLSVLRDSWVHYAPFPDPATAEQQMLDVFASGVSARARAKLHDPLLLVPFANLERAKGERKQHGIIGARAPRKPAAPAPSSVVQTSPVDSAARTESQEPTMLSPRRARKATIHAGPLRTQRVTETDISAGRIRVPSSAKSAFPGVRTEVAIRLRGVDMDVSWHPHYDTDQERSGVLSVGAPRLSSLVKRDEVLSIGVSDGRVAIS